MTLLKEYLPFLISSKRRFEKLAQNDDVNGDSFFIPLQ